MCFKLKKFIYKLLLSLAPLFMRILPQGIKNKLKNIIKTPEVSIVKLPYEAGAYPEGVNLFGYLKAQMGLGQGARLYARALQKSGLPYTLLNFSLGNTAKHADNEYAEQLCKTPKYNTNIIHVNPEQIPIIRLDYPASAWDKRYNIQVWLWELEEFPDDWMNGFKYADEIWTPSTFATNCFASRSPVPVRTIPYGICADTDERFDRGYFKLPGDRFLFLCMYDVNSMMARKNPMGAIEAFSQAFPAGCPDVGLVVKINNSNIHDLSLLKQKVKESSNTYLIDSVMSKTEVNSLIQCCNAFVSLHRSEGFGLVIAEAMYLGVPVIATNWSSNTDFMNAQISCPVDFQFVDVGYDYYKSKPGQRWAEPDKEHAAYYMQRLFSDISYYSLIAKAGENFIKTQYSEEQCAYKMLSRLHEIGLISAKYLKPTR